MDIIRNTLDVPQNSMSSTGATSQLLFGLHEAAKEARVANKQRLQADGWKVVGSGRLPRTVEPRAVAPVATPNPFSCLSEE